MFFKIRTIVPNLNLLISEKFLSINLENFYKKNQTHKMSLVNKFILSYLLYF